MLTASLLMTCSCAPRRRSIAIEDVRRNPSLTTGGVPSTGGGGATFGAGLGDATASLKVCPVSARPVEPQTLA